MSLHSCEQRPKICLGMILRNTAAIKIATAQIELSLRIAPFGTFQQQPDQFILVAIHRFETADQKALGTLVSGLNDFASKCRDFFRVFFDKIGCEIFQSILIPESGGARQMEGHPLLVADHFVKQSEPFLTKTIVDPHGAGVQMPGDVELALVETIVSQTAADSIVSEKFCLPRNSDDDFSK